MSATPVHSRITDAVRPRIHNHDIMNCTHESVRGNHLYSGRALGMSEPDDLIQLHPEFRSEWPAILAHYQRIGLGHSRNVIWDVAYGQLAKHPEHEPSVFFFDDTIGAMRPDGNWRGVVAYVNDKNNFMSLAEQLGMAVPRTLRFANPGQVSDFNRLPYPCYVKAAVSISGAGIYRCLTEWEVRSALARYPAGTPIQIQEEVDTELFLNVQYEVRDGILHQLMITEQVLEGFVHQGNRYPSKHAPWDSVGIMAQWMASYGMKGVFAFDVAVVEEGDGFRYLPIECNPRFNGASYPAAIALKLELDAWTAVQLPTRHRHLVDLDLRSIEYDPASRSGVIIVNWGTVRAGRIGFLLAGSAERQKALKMELLNRLG